jgi:hypothetical protein
VIEVASCVIPLTGLSLHEVLWELPAALAYQFQLVALQMRGADLRKDASAEIWKALSQGNGDARR